MVLGPEGTAAPRASAVLGLRRFTDDGRPQAQQRRRVTDEVVAAIHALSGQSLAEAYDELPAED